MPYFPFTDTHLAKQRDKEIIPVEDELMQFWEEEVQPVVEERFEVEFNNSLSLKRQEALTMEAIKKELGGKFPDHPSRSLCFRKAR